MSAMAAEQWDALIVGAGPAGLAAAAVLAQQGVQALLVDEGPVLGGRLRAQWYRRGRSTWDGAAEVRRLEASLAAGSSSVRVRLSTPVDVLLPAGEGFRAEAVGMRMHARTVLVATGATELPVPIPGWTLPGALAVGAAQTLWKGWGISPGRRGVVVGTSPLGFAVAQELRDAGVGVLPMVMPPQGPSTIHLGTVVDQWDRLFELRGAAPAWARPILATIKGRPSWRRMVMGRFPAAGVGVSGVRLMLGHQAQQILGDGRVEAIRLTRLDGAGQPVGSPFELPVDFVLLAGGLRPLADLLALAGALTTVIPGLGGEVPLVTRGLETSVRGLFAAGNALGVESAPVAVAQGNLAGLAMTAHLGRRVDASALDAAEAAVAGARQHAPFAFQPGLGAAVQELRRRSASALEAEVRA
jgi:sarcosine oxidase subunit alpha